MTLHIGDLRRVTATFKNAAGTPTNPTTIVLRLKKPDGTVTTPTPVADGSGVYHYDIPLDQAGRWDVRWEGTGAVTTAEPATFRVRRLNIPEAVA